MRSASEQNDLARHIIGASIRIHQKFGPGCFESAYAPCLAHELTNRGTAFETAVWMDLVYDQLVIPRAYQVDMIVEDTLLVEVKAVEQIQSGALPPALDVSEIDRLRAWFAPELWRRLVLLRFLRFRVRPDRGLA